MTDYYSPTMIGNQALRSIALSEMMMGDVNEGTKQAQACLSAYTYCRQQLLRGAHWDFARREAQLQLVADASGQTAGTQILVPAGFLYSYNYPTDCMKVRFIPANYWTSNPPVPSNNIVPPDSGAPVTPGLGQPPYVGQRLVPSRWLLTSDPNYVPDGASNDIPGISPIGQTLILSNIQNARCVYTMDATYPNLWDANFRAAMVAYMASEIAIALHKDKAFAMKMQAQKIAEAQGRIQQARVSNGNESWSNADIAVDWIKARASGGFVGNWGSYGGIGGPGYFFGGWDAVTFSDGAVF